MDLSNVSAQREGMDQEPDPLVVLFLFSLVYLSLALEREEGGNKWKVGRGSFAEVREEFS